jgi:hypothetical protein
MLANRIVAGNPAAHLVLREIPNSRQRAAMLSPSLSRITKRMRSSITELSFHGIPLSRLLPGEKV